LPERLSAWPEIQKRLVEYIPSITGSYASLLKISKGVAGNKATSLSAKTSVEKEGLKAIVTRGKGTFTFWVKPVFSGDILVMVSISSERGIAPRQVYYDLINPMADMLKREISARVESKITPR